MSTRQDGAPAPTVRSRDELIGWIAAGSKPASAWRIGTEHEKFLFTTDTLQPVPYEGQHGVRALMEGLREEGYGIALATSCASDELKHYLGLTGIADLLDAVACGEDAKREKPHPDLIQVALARAHSPAHAAMVGDSLYDAMAARAAGVVAFGFLTGGFSSKALQEAGCLAVYADPADMLQRFSALRSAARD